MPNIIEITDFHAPELDIYARLNENQLLNRAELSKGLFIAESPKVVERAMNAGYEPVSLALWEPQSLTSIFVWLPKSALKDLNMNFS